MVSSTMTPGRANRGAAHTARAALPMKDFLSRLMTDERIAPEIVHREVLSGRGALYADPDPPLPEALREALAAEGIGRLYTHQAVGLRYAREGKNVVTVTPTASGKTLVYVLPILEAILADPSSRALLLFPLKALAQDQKKRLLSLVEHLGGGVSVEIYDGDTPPSRRQALRKNPPNILLSNPDMLHQGLLPFHTQWEEFFRGLRYVVVDELHGYKGVFGSHVLQVLHRLRRVTGFYRARPQFIATSATIANPDELAERLTGLPFELITENGAPSSRRHILFLNPAASLYTSAVRLLEEAVSAGLKTIVFTKARKITELIHRWTLQSNPDLAGRISAYRAGYLPAERREIERRLQSGELDGVIATSALEMGIDIGGLDVCLLVGYPGTIANTWQRAGRVGRQERDSALFLIALPDALDQYFMRHPADFFRRSVEAAVVDGANRYLLRNHLVCAAQEVPLRADDPVYPAEEYATLLRELADEGELLEAAGGGVWFSRARQPQRGVEIRSAGPTYGIFEESGRRLVGHVTGWQALSECHPGAVYLHGGQTYLVTSLDLARREALVRRTSAGYYTQALSNKQTEILEVLDRREGERYTVSLGRLRVTETVVGYEKRSTSGREKLSEHELDLPPVVYETIGLWIEPTPAAVAGLVEEKRHLLGSLHALEHASLALMPLFALCDRNDLGGISFPVHPQTGGATVFLYDGHPGGVGLANRAFDVLDELLAKVLALVAECPCEEGCPSCIHSPKCGHGNIPLDKAGAIRLLEHLSGGRELKGDPEMAMILNEAALGAGDATGPPFSLAAAGGGGRPKGSSHTLSAGEGDPVPSPYVSRLPLVEGRDVVVFDVETQLSAEEVGGWHNAHRMRLALAVLFERKTGDYHTYFEKDATGLVERLSKSDLVVGFNNLRFDNSVLQAYTGEDLRALPTIDLLAEFFNRHGFRASLSAFASATLGAEKSADGLTSLQWWKEGKLDLIEEYCRKDVELTARLFDYALEHGYLLLDRAKGRVRMPLELPVSGVLGYC